VVTIVIGGSHYIGIMAVITVPPAYVRLARHSKRQDNLQVEAVEWNEGCRVSQAAARASSIYHCYWTVTYFSITWPGLLEQLNLSGMKSN
jgi:hypothetical protein